MYSGFQSPIFRIVQAKFSRIPDSIGKISRIPESEFPTRGDLNAERVFN